MHQESELPNTRPALISRRTAVRGVAAIVAAAGLGVAAAAPALAATSQNGWSAAKDTPIATLTVGAASFAPGVRKGDVHTILGYVAKRFNSEVEKLVKGTCWGFAYRDISGSTDLSNHASGTAIDCNAPQHPLGKAGTFSAAQVKAIHKIIADCNGVVRWGGDYNGRKDEMHFEINVAPGNAKIAALVKKING